MASSLPVGWKLRRLDELGTVGRGRSRHRPRNDPSLYGGPYAFIQTGDVSGCDVYITSHSQTYSEAGLAQSKLWEPGTLCIVNAGENTGETGILTFQACFPDSIIAFVPDPAESDASFVNYSLRLMKARWRAITRGATQDNLSVEKLLSFPIAAPPVGLQRRIGRVLSLYDDLIENNTKRIKIMEEMARALYREWFVNFRFPGHENSKFVNSRLGKIPEGWRADELRDHLDVRRGKSYKGSELADDGGLPFVNLKCFVRDGGFKREGIKRFTGKARPDQHVKMGDIVMAVTDMTQERRLIARAARIPRLSEPAAVISMDVVKLEPKNPQATNFLYAMFRFSQFADEVKRHANGANVLHLNPDRIESFVTVIPEARQLETFGNTLAPLLEEADILALKSDNLRATRDLLLPRLITGEIDVSSLPLEPAAS